MVKIDYTLIILIPIIVIIVGGFILLVVEKLFFKKKELPPNVTNIFIEINSEIYNQYKSPTLIRPVIERTIIEKVGNDITTKDNKLKINSQAIHTKEIALISSHQFIYHNLQKLLTVEAATALQFYLSYKTALLANQNSDYVLNGIRGIQEVSIRKWFELFEKVDLNGTFEGIVLPISDYLQPITVSPEIREEFVKFMEDLTLQRHEKAHITLGNKRIGLVRIHWKNLRRYLFFTQSLKKKGCDVIILCARGKYSEKATYVNEIFKKLNLPKEFRTKLITSTEYKNTSDLLHKKGRICTYFYFIKEQ